jgi:hypothetical protein
VACEQNLELYAIPAGQSRSIPWDGHIFLKQRGLCSECLCDQPFAVTGGDFTAAVRVYTDYQCMPSGCKTTSDGIIQMANTAGPYVSTTVPFSVPFADQEVVIAVTQVPILDAGARDTPASHETPDGTPAADRPAASSPADAARDLVSEPARAALSDLAGRTYQIAASESLPDASLYGRSCGAGNPGAVYRLQFSDDGIRVTIERTDGPEEALLTGTVRTDSSAVLIYDLPPTFAGGLLTISREDGNLIGQLAILGSGVPVIWCVEAPMRPV